jgi:hypothetical protein
MSRGSIPFLSSIPQRAAKSTMAYGRVVAHREVHVRRTNVHNFLSRAEARWELLRDASNLPLVDYQRRAGLSSADKKTPSLHVKISETLLEEN